MITPAVGVLPSSGGLAWASMTLQQQRIASGRLAMFLNPPHESDLNDGLGLPGAYFPTQDDGCPNHIGGSNIKVNQNCQNLSDANYAGRAQAENETSIAQDPFNQKHIIASYNDYRRGDGGCYGSYSLDGGSTWADTTVPVGFTKGTAFKASRQYWQAGGDTAVAWDTRGNAYFQCQVFQRGPFSTNNPDTSSAIYVFRSTGNQGGSWNFPGRPVIELATRGGAIEDKPLMTVDNHVNSPYRDRVYVTYTEFASDGTAYIWASYSADYGETFSKRSLVSTDSAMCPQTYGLGTPQGRCNENQFSQPFTGSDGALYVSYNNFNNATDGNENRNQVLLTKSTDGGQTFGAPVLVGYYYDLPDCATYQGGKDNGRACVPEKGSSTNSYFRATNYPSGAVNPLRPAEVSVTFGSYLNKNSKEANGCVPAGFSETTGQNLYTGVKTYGACSNDILVSTSIDGGASFTGTTTDPRDLTTVTGKKTRAHTDKFWQAAAYTRDDKLAVSYYDRGYGDDVMSGFSDLSLAGSHNLVDWTAVRVTTSSMPPPTQFGGLFMGDYTGLTAVDRAFPIWTDTRGAELFLAPGSGTPGNPPQLARGSAPNAPYANDQDVYTRAVDVPSGL